MTVFLVCAGLIGLLAAGLTGYIGRLRGAKRISLGDGGDPEMLAAVRAHGNLIEFAPLSLLLIYLLQGPYGDGWMAVLSVLLVVARFAHAGGMLGLLRHGRFIGAATNSILLVVASALLVLAGFGVRF